MINHQVTLSMPRRGRQSRTVAYRENRLLALKHKYPHV